MLYRYSASDKSGRLVEGTFEANDLSGVLQYLASKEMRPVSVKPVKEEAKNRRQFFGRINVTDKVFLTKYLALMLRVGTDLLSAINILISDFDKPAVQALLLEVRDNLSRGQPFYKAFETHQDAFGATFVSLVKAAEASGNLQRTFEELSEALVREAELRTRIRGAMIYPVVLMGVSVLIITFLVVFALPRIAKVFNDSGINPPFFSRVVFGIGLWAGANIFLIGGIVGGVAVTMAYLYFSTHIGKRLVERAFMNTPILKDIYRQLAVQRMASTMSSLMKAGLPIIETINVAADTVGLDEFKFSLLRIANEGLAKGLTIGEAFRRETIYPKVVTNLIAISEKAGHLEDVLMTLSDFYAAQIDSSVKSLVSLLEPILLLVMGSLVGIIALSIIVPIYQLVTQF